MDRRLLLLLACGALATAISLATSVKLTENDCLELPSQFSMETPSYKQLREDLLKIDANNDDSPSSIMDRIKDAAAKYLQTSEGRNVYAELSEFDKMDESCTPSDTQLVLDIIALIRDNPVLEPFIQFFKVYGKLKFTNCVEKPEIREKLDEVNMNARKLEQFFEIAFRNKNIIVELIRFKLWSSTFNVRGLVDFLRSLKSCEGTECSSTSPFELITDYLHEACAEFKEGREDALKTLSVAEALRAGGQFRFNDLIILDFNRVCFELKDQNILHQVEENINRQMSNSA